MHQQVHVLGIAVLLGTTLCAAAPQYEAERLIDNFSNDDLLTNVLDLPRYGTGGVRTSESYVQIFGPNNWWTETIAPRLHKVDLSGKALKIEYWAADSGKRTVRLMQQVKNFPNYNYTASMDIHVTEGRNQLVIPMSGFEGADPSSARAFSFNGPLAIHRLSLVVASEHTLTPADHQALVEFNDQDVLLVDDFSDWSTGNKNHLNQYRGKRKHVIIEDGQIHLGPDAQWTENLSSYDFEWSDHIMRVDCGFDMSQKSFRITYSTNITSIRLVRLVQMISYGLRIHRIGVPFCAGNRIELVIPLIALSEETHKFDPPLIISLYITGPITLHRIEVVKDSYVATLPAVPIQPETMNDLEYAQFHDRFNILRSNSRPTLAHPLLIEINASTLSTDAYAYIMGLDLATLKHGISVQFSGRSHFHYGDSNGEFFRWISHEMANSVDTVFRRSSSYALEVNPNIDINPSTLSVFRFSGRIVGLVIMHKHILNIQFTHDLYKSVVDPSCTIPDNIKAQTVEFRQGVLDIINAELLAPFSAAELDLIVSGTSNVNVSDWKANTHYDYYMHNSTSLIDMFWECVDGLNNRQRIKLIYLVTGAVRIPLTGFKDLSPRPFNIVKLETICKKPYADSTTNSLFLPPYPTIEMMRLVLEDVVKYVQI